jgi:hypothetical protein
MRPRRKGNLRVDALLCKLLLMDNASRVALAKLYCPPQER